MLGVKCLRILVMLPHCMVTIAVSFLALCTAKKLQLLYTIVTYTRVFSVILYFTVMYNFVCVYNNILISFISP